MSELNMFYKKLESFRGKKLRSLGECQVKRCFIELNKDGVLHEFEVTGWYFEEKPNEIVVSAINWTMHDGPCLVSITNESVKNWSFQPGLRLLKSS